MQIQIQFLSVTEENRGKFKMAEVIYKDLNSGKPGNKKIASFSKGVYDVIVKAKSGDLFTIDMQKNDKGYWDWTQVKPTDSVSTTPSAEGKSSFPAPKSNYETPEERAKKQVYIVRQSCIAQAVATLAATTKTGAGKIQIADVLQIASAYEDYVFGRDVEPSPSLADLPALDEDYIPM
jgi:hypothetical protein